MSVTLSSSMEDIQLVIVGVSILTQVKLTLIFIFLLYFKYKEFSVGLLEVQTDTFYFIYL